LSSTQVVTSVDDLSQVGHARRLAAALGQGEAWDPSLSGRIAVAVTEAAKNLFLHARGGEILLRALSTAEGCGLEMLAVDRGPGMDVDVCLRDGYSTLRSPGIGLGVIRRSADEFDIHTVRGTGTIMRCLICKPRPALPAMELGVVCLPMPGEQESGDSWAWRAVPGDVSVMVVDGLGHGLFAAEAAAAAVAATVPAWGNPADVMQRIHAALHRVRGAAVGVARIANGEVRFCGVGNVSATVVHRNSQRNGLASNYGVAGEGMPRIQEFRTPWTTGARLVLFSDGLANPWRGETEPGLLAAHPGVLAGAFYRDFSRRRDDVTVLALAERAGAPA